MNRWQNPLTKERTCTVPNDKRSTHRWRLKRRSEGTNEPFSQDYLGGGWCRGGESGLLKGSDGKPSRAWMARDAGTFRERRIGETRRRDVAGIKAARHIREGRLPGCRPQSVLRGAHARRHACVAASRCRPPPPPPLTPFTLYSRKFGLPRSLPGLPFLFLVYFCPNSFSRRERPPERETTDCFTRVK